MGCFKKAFPAFLIIGLLAGCVTGFDENVASNVGLFDDGIKNMGAVVNRHFDDTENASRKALENNLKLQFDLGGTPNMDLPPLFTAEDRLARSSILEALSIYSGRLTNALAGRRKEPPLTGVSDRLEKIEEGTFDISHSSSANFSDNLVSSLSGFSKILLAPKVNRKLGEIVATAHPYVEKLASLLYLDLGSTTDQSELCDDEPLISKHFNSISEIKLCTGGLRELMSMSVAADIITLQQRVALVSAKIPADITGRQKYVSEILMLQQTGQRQDAIIHGTQKALIQMVAAHQELRDAFGGNSEEALPLTLNPGERALDPISVFANSASSLIAQLNRVN
ncbi:MAG: hypothetical protein V7750_16360 [Sneathiella sp.]